MNKEELNLIGKLNDPDVQEQIKNLQRLAPEEGTLVEDNRTLEEIIREVAEEEGMSYEQTLAFFKKGMKQAWTSKSGMSAQQKTKARKKKKMAKASKKRNR
jgi:beta-phosphoglucomutase-like phosphatase (HAD superfamily)